MKTIRPRPVSGLTCQSFFVLCLLTFVLRPTFAQSEPSDATAECLFCHEMATPGIVEDWKRSRHASITPAEALAEEDPLARRITAESVPKELAGATIGCYECHSLRAEAHADNFEHFGYQINVVVSPADCATCHPAEQDQYKDTKKAHAIANLRDNPVYHALETQVTGLKTYEDGNFSVLPPSAHTAGETCYACHGTVVEVKGLKTIDSVLGKVEVPILTNWPNQGVGRVNPDGSKGACTACHTRHGFSIEMARKPYTCAQCHIEPDVPAYNVWKESKHGNIVLSESAKYDWSAVPWKVGTDFKSPTCAACHNALVTNPAGDEVIAERTHNFSDRLWLRIFGLPTSHPQPARGNTTTLVNADGQPLPVTFSGVPAAEGLIDAEEMAARKATMTAVCRACHSTDWVAGHFEQFDTLVAEVDHMVLQTTALMSKAWESGLADPTNPFDEALEHLWVNQWLINANAARYASAMNGQDFATFKYGWWGLSQTLAKMHQKIGAD